MTRKSDHRAAWRCLCVWVLLSLIGCGEPSGRQSLEGTVTLDGAPLVDGNIKFVPQLDTKGPVAGGKITEGQFSISTEGGTFAGEFRVEITATRKTGKKVKDYKMDKMIDDIEQFLPPQYNRQSELTADVTESGPNRFDFKLSLL